MSVAMTGGFYQREREVVAEHCHRREDQRLQPETEAFGQDVNDATRNYGGHRLART